MLLNCEKFGIEVIHLTLNGHPNLGHRAVYFDGNPKNIVLNRERCFTEFLRTAEDDVYLFTEPDSTILKEIPPLEGDICLLCRPSDGVKMNPSWRMARPKALPIFEEILRDTQASGKHDWHGDSDAFIKLWERMGMPNEKRKFKYLGLEVETRKFTDYVKPGLYCKHAIGLYNKRHLCGLES